MDEKKKAELIAQAENVEAIKEFFTEWWSVEQLYETTAKATTIILNLITGNQIGDEEKKELRELMDQHLMLIDLVKPFAGDDDEK